MRRRCWMASGALALLLASPAWAHVRAGPTEGIAAGVLHPLHGVDHWAVMVAVGIWARFLGGRATWAVPLGFLASMGAGSWVGMHGRSATWVETGILASAFLMGLLLAAAVRLPSWLGTAMGALFAFFHGHAHGTEVPLNAAGWAYGLGFSASTALLHLLGILVGEGLLRWGQGSRRPDRLVRLAGVALLALRVGGGWM